MTIRRPVDNERTLAETAALEALQNRHEGSPDIILVVVKLRSGRADVNFICASGTHAPSGYIFLYEDLKDKLDDEGTSLV